MTAAMEALKSVAIKTLRKSDIVTRFSPTQYILLLSNINYENCEMVLKRVTDKFRQQFKQNSIEVMATQCPVSTVT